MKYQQLHNAYLSTASNKEDFLESAKAHAKLEADCINKRLKKPTSKAVVVLYVLGGVLWVSVKTSDGTRRNRFEAGQVDALVAWLDAIKPVDAKQVVASWLAANNRQNNIVEFTY